MEVGQFTAMCATLLVEVLAIWLITQHLFANFGNADWILCVVGTNLISHPLAWTAVSTSLVGYAEAELLVCLFEAVLYRGLLFRSTWTAMSVSILANSASISTYYLVQFA